MVKISIYEIITSINQSNFLWILIPIFFIGIITDKYQEEFKTSIGNAISNGALVIFSAFSWLQLIFSRSETFPLDITISQIIFSIIMIIYGFSIIASGFKSGEFARLYGRIRVITFMLMFFTMIIYIPILYNFVSIILFVLIFPFYYAFITEVIKKMPSINTNVNIVKTKTIEKIDTNYFRNKINEYLK